VQDWNCFLLVSQGTGATDVVKWRYQAKDTSCYVNFCFIFCFFFFFCFLFFSCKIGTTDGSLHVGKGDKIVVPGHARLCARIRR
jgi:hypothetical protein